jgi:hypothetical protein
VVGLVPAEVARELADEELALDLDAWGVMFV